MVAYQVPPTTMRLVANREPVGREVSWCAEGDGLAPNAPSMHTMHTINSARHSRCSAHM